MKNKNSYLEILVIVAAILGYSSCQPPAEPPGLSNNGSALEPNAKPVLKEGEKAPPKTGDGTKADPAKPGDVAFDAGGALVGTDAQRALVKACLDKSLFYDRQGAACTTLGLAKVGCTIEKIKLSMTSQQFDAFNVFLKDPNSLSGFVLDQCLACPDPNANAFCKGTSQTIPTGPGFRLFLVKEAQGSLNIQTVFVKSTPST
ncbi:MAG: hypothetical protein NTV34_08990 [Proteobacteria bacterium]|nr:hypothetical protein [Pseudomonadota bacterium]